MWKSEARRTDSRATTGLLALGSVAVACLLLLLVAQAGSAAGWLFNAYLLLAVAAAGIYLAFVFRPHRELEREAAEAAESGRRVEEVLLDSLDRLRSGDLVNSSVRTAALPGELAAAFASAAHSLEVLALQIQASSSEVAGAANSVNQIASELASGSSEQAASVVEITAAMEELARTASQIAESTGSQAELAARAELSGDGGAAAVAEAVSGVEEVRKRIASIASRADTLGARSQEIFRVLDLITDIAQETHILSLNAAIEAAAAEGEHGRRFSVVAEEVRRLAQRSQESADSVRVLLDEFAGSIRATAEATEEGSHEAAQVLERAQAAAGAIAELRATAAEAAEVARGISGAAQQQNAASNQVVLTLREASQVVQRMADGLKTFSDTANRLNQLGLAVQILAQSFNLAAPHSLKHVAENWAVEVRKRLSSWEAIERLLEELVEQLPFVECLYFMDTRGSRVALVANRHLTGDREIPAEVQEGEGFTERPWFKAATRDGRTILTPVFRSLLSDEPILTAASPVFDGDELVGVLGLDINVDAWTKH